MSDFIYFKNIPKYGNLYMDYIIVEEDYPLLFILRDDYNRFICFCFEMSEQQSWIINKVTISNIKDLLTDKMDMREPFLVENDDKKIIIHRNKNDEYTYELADKKYIVDNDIIPDEGDYLEVGENEFKEYIDSLSQ